MARQANDSAEIHTEPRSGQFSYDVGYERATWQAINAVADALIAVGGSQWRIGDGEGGGILQAVYKAGLRAGFDFGDTYAGPRDE